MATSGALDRAKDILSHAQALRQSDNDEATKKALRKAALDLAAYLEPPEEAKYKLWAQPYDLAAATTALEAGWLDLIASASGPIDATTLAHQTNASPALLVRIMHDVVASNLVRETGPSVYQATATTLKIVQPGDRAFILHAAKLNAYAALALPGNLKKHGYQMPTGATDCAFHDHFEITFWDRLKGNPWEGSNFNQSMRVHVDGRPHWLSSFPLKERLVALPRGGELDLTDNAQVLLVDVGGGIGEDLHRFAQRRAELGLPGRLILQDQPQVIAKSMDGDFKIVGRLQPSAESCRTVQTRDLTEQTPEQIETMPHDFFQEQPIKGARAYYFRKMITYDPEVLHDWPDDKAVAILSKIKPAMDRTRSSIFVHEVALPKQHVSPYGAWLDLTMLSLFSASQRTEEQWQRLFESAGLVVKSITMLDEGPESVIEAILP